MRIVSLVPSLTKTICDLGLKDQLVGITKFCVDPPDAHRFAKIVGGTKDPDLSAIAALKPTHVLINEEENRLVDQKFLLENFHTLNTFPKSPLDVPKMLDELGVFIGNESAFTSLRNNIERELEGFKVDLQDIKKSGNRFLYLIWRDPWMAVSQDTYISRLLELAGYENVLSTLERYPVINPSELNQLNIDYILMSSEPWPFRVRDMVRWREISDCQASIYHIDGKLMSWYGSLTLDSLKYIKNIGGQMQPMSASANH